MNAHKDYRHCVCNLPKKDLPQTRSDGWFELIWTPFLEKALDLGGGEASHYIAF